MTHKVTINLLTEGDMKSHNCTLRLASERRKTRSFCLTTMEVFLVLGNDGSIEFQIDCSIGALRET